MGYIFMFVFMLFGLVTHDNTFFMVAGLFSISGAIDILANKIPEVEIEEVKEPNNTQLAEDLVRMCLNEALKKKQEENNGKR